MSFDVFSNLNLIRTNYVSPTNIISTSYSNTISLSVDGYIKDDLNVVDYGNLYSTVRPNNINTSYNPEPIPVVPEPNESYYSQINDLNALSDQFKLYLDKYNQLVKIYHKVEVDKNKVLNSIVNIENHKAQIQQSIEQLNNQINQLNNQATQLSNQANNLRNQANNYELQANNLEQSATMLQQQAQALLSNPFTASAGAQLMAQAQALRAQAMTLKNLAQQLKTQAQQLDQQAQELRNKANELRNQVNQLQNKLQQLDIKLNNLKQLLNNINNYQEKLKEAIIKVVKHLELIYKRAQELINQKQFENQLNLLNNILNNLNNIKGLGFYNANNSNINPMAIFSLLSTFMNNPLMNMVSLIGGPKMGFVNNNFNNPNFVLPALGMFSSFIAFSSMPMPSFNYPAFSVGFVSSFRKVNPI
jgi:X-X-X-Leu-X-X-Gly heptad repeat protein